MSLSSKYNLLLSLPTIFSLFKKPLPRPDFLAFEPLSLALARLHQYEAKPQLISHEGVEGTTLLISHQSRVFASTVFSDLSQKNQEKTRLTDFVHTNWHLKPAKEIKAETFQAALGLVIKEDLKGKDAQTLNLAPTCPDPVPSPASLPDPIPDLSSSSPPSTTPISTLSKFSKFRPPSLPQLSRQFWFILLFTTLFIAGLSWLVLKPHSADLLAPTGSSAPTQETPVPTQIPSPTPAPDLKLLKINLLNGAGTPGLANQVTVILENAGFEDIKTGNADNFDYDQTQIRIKQEKENYLSALVSALSDYPIASSTSVLKEDDPFDAVIILGKEKE